MKSYQVSFLFLSIFSISLVACTKLVSEPFPAMASDTCSTDRLSDMEKRMDHHAAIAETNRTQLDQNTTDISDLKFSISQIQSSLKDLAASVVALAHTNQGDINSGSSSSPHRNPNIQFGSHSAFPPYLPPTKQTHVEFPALMAQSSAGGLTVATSSSSLMLRPRSSE